MSVNKFILERNSIPTIIPGRFHGIDICSEQVYSDFAFTPNHTHYISSEISDEVFQSLVDYMINGIPPQITKENFADYLKINDEFNLFKDFIKKTEDEFGVDLKCIIQLSDTKSKQDNKVLEIYIAKNLDYCLKNYEKDMMKIPINNLYNIFNNSQRKLDDHELAYQFIKEASKLKSDFYILLPFLDGDKLKRDSQIEIENKKNEGLNFLPKNVSVLSLKEHQDDIYAMIHSLQNEMNSLKNSLKQNEEIMAIQKKEIIDLKNSLQEKEKMQNEMNSLKDSQKQNEQIIIDQNKEICELKDIVVHLKNSLQEKDSCYLSYFGEKLGNYPYATFHVKANVKAQIPFYHVSQNSIINAEFNQKGTKITFLKSGMYLLMFNIMTNTVFQKNTTIRISTTQGQHYSHYLNSYKTFQSNINLQVISGHKLCPYEKGDYIYVCVDSPIDFDITGNSTVNTSFEIIKT